MLTFKINDNILTAKWESLHHCLAKATFDMYIQYKKKHQAFYDLNTQDHLQKDQFW